MELLREMYRDWSFFRTLLSNMDMVLFKSDIHIASRYAELVADADLREDVFGRIRREMQRTIEQLLAITEQKELLESNPSLARSFRNRVPLYRSAQPPPGGSAPTSSIRQRQRKDQARHSAHDQRHRRRSAQQRLSGSMTRCATECYEKKDKISASKSPGRPITN